MAGGRTENANASRHVAEFWMIEPEIALADLSDIAAFRAVSDQIAPRSPPPKPSPIKGEGLYLHSYLYSRPLDGAGREWG
jgi:hypothetical protein